MINRLGDLPSWTQEDFKDEEEEEEGEDDEDPSKDLENQKQQPKFMENFFREVDSIKEDIEAVAQASKEIVHINEQAIHATTTEEENELSRQLRPLIDTTNKRAKRTKTLLGLLKEETAKLQNEKKLNASDIRYVLYCV